MGKWAKCGMVAVASLALIGMLAACSSAEAADRTEPAATGADAELEQLIADAKKEGSVAVYAVMDERMLQEMQAAFQDEYGVTMDYIRLASAELAQRFSAERDANTPMADMVISLNDGFVQDSLKDGSFVPLEDADVPGYPNAIPEEAQLDGAAIIQVAELALGYNTDHVDGLSSWEDLLAPALQGKIAVTDSALNNALYYSLAQEYGDQYLSDLRGQVGRVFTSGSQGIEAISAGEMWVVTGTLGAAVRMVQGQGAPVDAFIPSPTMKVPTIMAMNAEAPHPAAARLFAYFLSSEEGLDIINEGLGLVSPAAPGAFEGGWLYSPELDQEAAADKANIRALLGLD